jgi:hypothetical protein
MARQTLVHQSALQLLATGFTGSIDAHDNNRKRPLSEYRPRGNFNCHMGIADKYIRFNMNVNQNFGCGETPPLRYIV